VGARPKEITFRILESLLREDRWISRTEIFAEASKWIHPGEAIRRYDVYLKLDDLDLTDKIYRGSSSIIHESLKGLVRSGRVDKQGTGGTSSYRRLQRFKSWQIPNGWSQEDAERIRSEH
jgi:hypothetical protein